jgi:hypothetical protein
MKNRDTLKIIILALSPAVIVVAVLLFLLLTQRKTAVKVTYLDVSTGLEPKNYGAISLLCRTDQMTGVWFVAIAVKDDDGNYQHLDRSIALIVTGTDPFFVLKDELTIYSDNHFILHGELSYNPEAKDADGYFMYIKDWDIAYPVKTTMRPFFMQRSIYSFEYEKIALITEG